MAFSGIAKVFHWSSHVSGNRRDAGQVTWLTKMPEFDRASNTVHFADSELA